MTEYNTRTIKLKLRVISENKEEKDAAWKRIRQVSNATWRSANMIVSGQFLNEQLMKQVYVRTGIDTKDKEAVFLAECRFNEFFGVKRQATTERDIKHMFPDLPSCVSNTLNQIIVSSYNSDKKDMAFGKRSIRTYKDGMPIPVRKNAISITTETILWKISKQEQIQFGVVLGRDRANNRLTIERILSGVNDYCAASIMVRGRDIFLLLPVKEPKTTMLLDESIAVGVDLGIAVPAYVATSKGPQRMAIGSAQDFLRVRTQIRARRRRLQARLVSVASGKGRQKKLKAFDRIKDSERKFANQYNHFVSKKVVDFAIKNNAGAIKMEMLEGFGREDKNSFILSNWSYFELQSMIEYKAKRVGIKVIKVDPYHTSQTCSECGNYEPGQRSGRDFECKSCGFTANADYNAAVNIARSEKKVAKKEECAYYKRIEASEDAWLESQP